MSENQNDISGKVGLNTTDFKAGISEINRSINVIKSEFQAAAAGMDDWSKSAEGLETRINALSGITELQQKKIANLKVEYERIAVAEGESSKAAQDLAIKINKEQAALNSNEKELKQCKDDLNNFAKEEDHAAEKSEKLHSALGKIGLALGKVGSTIGKAAVTSIAAVGAVAVAAAAGTIKLMKSSLESADNIQRLADVTGFTAEQIQELKYAGTKLDVELETMTGAQTKLIKAMAAAEKPTSAQAKAFSELGIKTQDANGHLRDSKAVMFEALGALGGIGNETERDALAMTLFGKSARDLNPLIKAGTAELANLTAEAHRNGAVLTNEQIAALDTFGDNVDAFKLDIKGLGASVAAGLLPAFSSVLDTLEGLIPAVGAAIKSGDWSAVGTQIATALGGMFSKFANALPQLAQVASSILTSIALAIVTAMPTVLPALVSTGVQFLQTIVTTIANNAPMLIEAFSTAITQLIAGIAPLLPQIAMLAIQLLSSLAQAIMANLPMIIQAGIDTLIALINGLTITIPQLIPAIVSAITLVIQTIVQNLPLIIDAGLQLLIAVIQGIVNALPQLIQMITDMIPMIVQTILENLPKIIDAGISILMSIINGIVESLPKLIDEIINMIPKIVKAIIDNLPKIIAAGIKIIMAVLEGIITNLPQIIGEFIKMIPTIAKTIIDNMGDIVVVGGQLIWALIKGLGEAAWNLISKAGQLAGDFVTGIWNGIKSAAGWLWEKVKGFFEGIVDSVKKALGIASPSKVMAGIGKNMALGVGTGWTASMGRVTKDMLNSLNKETGKLQAQAAISISGGGNAGADGTQVLTNNYNMNYTINSPRALSLRDLRQEMLLAEQRQALLRG